MIDVKKAARDYRHAHIFSSTEDYLVNKAFLAGAAWQREMDAKLCETWPNDYKSKEGLMVLSSRYDIAQAIRGDGTDCFKCFPTIQAVCECGHPKRGHIYEEGACRSGEVCPCNEFRAKSVQGTKENP